MWHCFQFSGNIFRRYRIVLMLYAGICCFLPELNAVVNKMLNFQCGVTIVYEVDTGQCYATVMNISLPETGKMGVTYKLEGATTNPTNGNPEDASGNQFNVGITKVTYEYTGGMCYFWVIVIPSINLPVGLVERSNEKGECFYLVDGDEFDPQVNTQGSDIQCNWMSHFRYENNVNNTESLENEKLPVGVRNIIWTFYFDNSLVITRDFTVNVVDDEKPVLTCPTVTYPSGQDYFQTDPGKCSFRQNFSIIATDNCTPEVQLYKSYEIINDGESIASGSGIIIDFDFPTGTNTVTYTVTDVVGNTETCSFSVRVNDDRNPVAECKDNIPVYLDIVTGKVTITASQIDNGSSDNCGIVSYELYNYEFDCTDLGDNTVTLYVYDKVGNSDYCTTTVNVQYSPLLSPHAEFLKTEICNGDYAELELTSPGFESATGWIWTVNVPLSPGISPSDGLDGTANSSYTVTRQFFNTTDDVAEVIYTVTPKMYDNDMCTFPPIERSFQIAPEIRFDLVSNTFQGGHNISCYGFSDGIIMVENEIGGWSADGYNYEWEGSANTGNAPTTTNRQAGTHGVTVSDKLVGCMSYKEITLTQPERLSILTPLDKVSPNCYGPTGSFTVHARGGTRSDLYAYEYKCVAEGLMSDYIGPDSVFTALLSGNYRITVTDVNGCNIVTDYYLDYYVGDNPLNPGWNKRDVSCFGKNDGRMNPNISSATEYTWKYNGDVFKHSVVEPGDPMFRYANNDFLIENLAPGNYELTIVNEIGCVLFSEKQTITEPDPIIFDFVTEDVSCDPGDDGHIKIDVTGGKPGYAFTCNDVPTTSEITGLSPGAYTVVITDADGCRETIDANIRIPLPLNIITEYTSGFNEYSIDCYGNHTGEIILNVQNGRGDYIYHWSSPDATIVSPHVKNQSNLTSGIYLVTVTDGFNCMGDASVTLTQPERLWAQTNITDIICPGDDTGSIQVMVKGGVWPYRYQWSNGDADSSLAEQLTAGVYEIRITDNNNCSFDLQATIAQPPVFYVNFITRDAFCPETDDGDIRVVVSGGTPPYTYLWSGFNGATSPNLTGLRSGIYSIEIADDLNCRYSQTVELGYTSAMCLRIPNAFSPNDDGANDRWEITVGDPNSFIRTQLSDLYPEAIVEVWAANWGMLLYRSQKGYPEPWDGKYNGKHLPVNSYLYIIRLNNNTRPITGNVTIIR